jgi:hypothetical protein
VGNSQEINMGEFEKVMFERLDLARRGYAALRRRQAEVQAEREAMATRISLLEKLLALEGQENPAC